MRRVLAFLLCVIPSCSLCVGQVDHGKPVIENRESAWELFTAQLADSDVSYVRCPPGDWKISQTLLIQRSNVVVDFDGATLIPVDGLFMPIRVMSAIEQSEWHATGKVDEDTRVLTLDGREDMRSIPGEVHLVKTGVNFSDPNEAQSTSLRVVESIIAGKIVYTRPFGVRAEVYESFEDLAKLSGYPEKVGPWGPGGGVYGSQWKRGLGRDHGIRRLIEPVSRVTLLRPRIVYPEGSRLYGAWGISFAYCTDCLIVDADIVNPCGSAVHLDWCRDCVVSGLSLTGAGGGNPWAHQKVPRRTNAAIAVSAWGAEGCKVSRVSVESTDTSLLNFEAGCRNMEIRDCDIATTWTAGVQPSPQFGIYGPGRVSLASITIDTAPQSSSIFPGWLADTTLADLRFTGDRMPDYLAWSGRGEHLGPMQWGAAMFGEVEQVEFSFTPTKDGFAVPYPEGLILSSEFVVGDWAGIRHLGIRDNYLPGESLSVTPKPEAYQVQFGHTYQQYRQQLAGHRVWIVRGATVQPITVRCKMMRRI